MKELRGFYGSIFFVIISLFIYHLDKEYGMHFDDNYRSIFTIVMPACFEGLFLFIYSIIAEIVDNKIN